MSQTVIYCTGCGEPNPPDTAFCMRCRASHDLTRRELVTGIAFVLNELQVAPFTEVLSKQQIATLRDDYLDELRSVVAPAPAPAPPQPAPRPAAAAPAQPAPLPRPAAPAPVLPPIAPPPPPREPYDWSWLAEQQANLFLFAGAFLTVIAALIYVGYSGQAVSGALKMTLLSVYTVAFLAGGLVCLRIPRVSIAGQVFFAVGAILVPLNFVAARTIFSNENLNTETLWLAGSIVTAAFYSAVASTGLGRAYAFGGGVALVSSVLAGTAAVDLPWEWRPVCFIALAIAMSLTQITGTEVMRRRIGSVWGAQAQFIALAAIVWAAGLAPFAAAPRHASGHLDTTTLWFLPATFAALLSYAAIPALAQRRQEAGLVAIAAFAGAWISVVYALDVPTDYYVVAIAGIAPILGLGVIALSEPISRRLPEGFGEMLRTAAIVATLASAVGALAVADSSGDRADFGAAQRWSLAPSFALILAFYLLDAFGSRRREAPAAAALAFAGLCAAIVFGLHASPEYYAFAFIVPAIALAALARWASGPAFARLAESWQQEVRVVGLALTAAGIAIALVAAVAASSPDGTYQPDYRAYLPLAFVAAAVLFTIEASRSPRSGETEGLLLSAALLMTVSGVIVSLPFAFNAGAAWYGAALAGAGAAIAYGGRVWTPRWLDERARDGVAVLAMTAAWLPFEDAYADEPRLGAAVHLAASFFYATAAFIDRSGVTLNEFFELKGARPVRAAVGWLYAAALTGVIGYVFLLRSLPVGEEAARPWFALPLMALALGFVALAATSRWCRAEFRWHLYVISLATALCSLVAADGAGTLAVLVTVYAAAFVASAVWEDAPILGAPAVVFVFAAVPAWRARFDASLAVIPIVYMLMGLGLSVTTAIARDVRRWREPLRAASAAFVIAAPVAGFGLLAAHTHHGLMAGVHFERTALYQWSTFSVAVAGVVGLVASQLERRRWIIVPGTAILTVALLLEIGHFRPENPQWYTAVIGAYLLALGVIGLWKFHLVPELDEAAPWIEALGATVIMAPSALQSLQGEWRYLLVLLVEATAFFAAGVTLRRRGILGAAMLFLAAIAGRTLFDAVNALPNWIVVMLAGMALLGVGMGILLGRERWNAWQRSLLGWWDAAGGQPR
jgi:hypothetical protein